MTIVKWYQPGDEDVDGWEFQYSANGLDWFFYEEPLEPVPCEICWQTNIYLDDDAYLFRARSVREDLVSEWSDIIALPEPDPIGVFAFALLLLAIAPKNVLKKIKRNGKNCG